MDDDFRLTKKEAEMIASITSKDPPPLVPPTKEEMERIKEAQEELAKIAAAESEEERKRLMEEAINRRHLYRGTDKAGNVHEHHQIIGMKFKVHSVEKDGKITEEFCATGDQAMHCVKNGRKRGATSELIPLDCLGLVKVEPVNDFATS